MTAWSDTDRRMMQRALQLARAGLATTHPNPRVGCVLAQGSEIVGEGFHERAGEPHAEVFALRNAAGRARGATAYVTLEPCSHHGRTPPCADALIEAGIARLVYASGDPDPRVDGRGAARIAAAGIVVERGLLADEADELNAGFLTRLRTGRPWVRVKIAASLDGRTALASGESKWITGEAARADVQHWRARSSAVLTGIGTLLADDPLLNVRGPGMPSRQPLRIVLDSRFQAPATSKIFAARGPVQILGVVADAAATLQQALRQTARANAVADAVPDVEVACVAAAPDGRVDLPALLQRLGAQQVNELHVEAGATLSGAFIAAGLADELLVYVAPTLLGVEARPLAALPALARLADRPHFRIHSVEALGEDLRLLLRPKKD